MLLPRHFLLPLFFSLAPTASAGDDKAVPIKENTVQVLMREKLEAAHGLLEGLVRENFDSIQQYAERLRNISHATTWYKPDNADFLHYAKNFQNSADYLSDEAKKKNLEGVSLGYVRLTLDCVQCHNYVRAGRPRN